MKKILLFTLVLLSFELNAQQIQFLDLPSFFDREFEISGLTGDDENLFLAAERCGKIFIVEKESLNHIKTIHLNFDNLDDGIEIEGLCLYQNFLLITDEKNGKIFSLNLRTEEFNEISVSGKDLSSFIGKYGMEGIAIDPASNTLYLLREKNKDLQSEIHTFSLINEAGELKLEYKAQTLIQHGNENWRYTGLSIDVDNNRLLCLKSHYNVRACPSNRREIEYILLDSFPQKKCKPIMLVSISEGVSFMKESFATNVEGIYSDSKSIYITSDNGEGRKDCNDKSIKTALIKITLD